MCPSLILAAHHLLREITVAPNRRDDLKQKEIEQVLSAASKRTISGLSENIFMTDSVVVLEKSSSGFEISSIRIMTKPDRYELILNKNGQCFIRHDETNLQWFLFKAKCVSQ